MRITPITTPTSNPHDETVILAYPFTPLPAHVTSTEKAELTQRQLRDSGIKTLLAPQAGESIKSAGVFALDSDVTKSRSGALLRAGVPLAKLPFRVKGTDILLEGVGWVELVCQVRHRRRRWDQDQGRGRGPVLERQEEEYREQYREEYRAGDEDTAKARHRPRDALSILDNPPPPPPPPTQHHHPRDGRPRNREQDEDDPFPTPTVEIFTPEGGSVGQRRSMGAWMLIHGARRPGERKLGKSAGKARPRRSMKGVKRRGKEEKRAEGEGRG